MNELQVPPKYAHTLHELEKLSRNHLLHFRLEVGRLMLEDFFDGDLQTYQSRDTQKPQKFGDFTTACADHLAEIGLGEQVLRQCIIAYAVCKALPAPLAAKLLFSQVVELTRVEDAATRSVLAQATIDNGWTSRQLKDAAKAVKARKWIDGDPKMPGLQPPVPPEPDPAKVPAVGRLVTRSEKLAAQVDAWAGELVKVDGKQVSAVQKDRLRKAVGELRAKLLVIEGLWESQ